MSVALLHRVTVALAFVAALSTAGFLWFALTRPPDPPCAGARTAHAAQTCRP